MLNINFNLKPHRSIWVGVPHLRPRTRSRIWAKPDYLQIERAPPRSRPPVDKEIGGYCIRAQARFIHEKTGEEVGDVTGYDDNLGVAHLVEEMCERQRHGRQSRCTDAGITFLREMRGRACEGVFVHDYENGESEYNDTTISDNK